MKNLLNRNPKYRLGAKDDAEELKRHPFFADINWEALSNKLITPPFKPKLDSETDTSNFDPKFTNALLNYQYMDACVATLAVSPSQTRAKFEGFEGFTFVDKSLMDENMRGRVGEDCEDEDEKEEKEPENSNEDGILFLCDVGF